MDAPSAGARGGGAGSDDDQGDGRSGDSAPYNRVVTPVKAARPLAKQETFNSDDVESEDSARETDVNLYRFPVHGGMLGGHQPPPVTLSPHNFAAATTGNAKAGDEYTTGLRPNASSFMAGTGVGIEPITRRRMSHAPGSAHFDLPTSQMLSLAILDDQPMLPTKYLNSKYKLNSYFAIRLLRLMQFIVAIDIAALLFYYMNKPGAVGSVYVRSPIRAVFDTGDRCERTSALASIVYHLVPGALIMGLPASGIRMFEPFKRQQRIDHSGRLQKVKRTLFLQFCEMTGIGIMIITALLMFVTLYFFITGRLFRECRHASSGSLYAFCLLALVVYWLMFVQIRYFTRFREHLKMTLGAFKESDQTGDVKAFVLRSKLRRRKQQQLKTRAATAANGDEQPIPIAAPPQPTRKQVIADVRKRLFRGAQLGDLRLLRRSLRIARINLGENFATDIYPDVSIMLWFLGFSRKNPMHVAAYHGNIEAMELFIRAGFNVNAFDKISRVRFSIGDLFWYMASYFVRKPVVTADESHSSIFKTTLVTPLHCAVSTGRVDAVRWLIHHGADVNLCSKSSYRSEAQLPPIFVADHPEIVRELLAAGANHLAIPDPGHMNTLTVLQLAYMRGNYAVAQVLEEWGGDVALTPLHTAAAMNDTNLLRSFLRKRVDPNCLGELGYVGLNKRTPLHWAAVNGAVDAVELLLDGKADANFQDSRGRTPLHWAARVNRTDIVRVLLDHGADPNIVDESDMTPIVCAACAGGTSAEMFKALTSKGGNINHQLKSTGDTALHLAVKLDDQQTALALLSIGGDIMRTNKDGLRPIDCTTSTRLQFEIKRAAGNRDVMISYTHTHKEFALKLRKSLEDANITTWVDMMDPSGIGGGAIWREEIARGITNAAVVLCIITEDYTQSEWCLKELALAKQVGTPIVAISTENAKISEELQVYLYTRQLIPFEDTIETIEHVSSREVYYTYRDDAYKDHLRMLLDGLRDEIEKRKEDNIKKNMRRGGTSALAASSGSHRYDGVPLPSDVYISRKGEYNGSALSSTDSNDGTSNPLFGGGAALRRAQSSLPYNRLPSGGSGGHLTGRAGMIDSHHLNNTTSLSIVSSTSSMSDDFGNGLGANNFSNSIILDQGGYYFHKPDSTQVTKLGLREGSIVESFQELETATDGGEQFVFISHGDHHSPFVKKLCAELCREGGLRCFVDRRHRVKKEPATVAEDEENEAAGDDIDTTDEQDMSRRIHEAKEAILKCSAFVVIVSEKTLNSEMVRDQLAFAEDKGKKILPVVVNRLHFGLDIKYSLSRSEFFHFFTKGDMMGFHKSLERLLDVLREEMYGITIENERELLKVSSYDQLSSYGGSRHSGVDTQSNQESFVSYRHSSFLSNDGSIGKSKPRRRKRSGADRSFLPPSRLSYRDSSLMLSPSSRHLQGTNTGAASAVGSKSITSDTSLSMSIVGNFAAIIGRITDEIDEDGYDDHLHYDDEFAEEDEDEEETDDDKGEFELVDGVGRSLVSTGDLFQTREGSISILERKSDTVAHTIDVMAPPRKKT